MVMIILLALFLIPLVQGIKLIRKGKRWLTSLGVILVVFGALRTFGLVYNLIYNILH